MDSLSAQHPHFLAGSSGSGCDSLMLAQVAQDGILVQLDWAILGAALVLTGVATAVWLIRSRRDPLGRIPGRAHRVDETSVALAMMAYLAAVLVGGAVAGLIGLKSTEPSVAILIGLGANLAGIAGCLWIIARRFGGGVRFAFSGFAMGAGLRRLGFTALMTIVAVGMCQAIFMVTVFAIGWLKPDFPLEPHSTIQALHAASTPSWLTITLWIGAAVLAPLAEELFFRGLLQSFLGRLLRSRWVAITLSSAVFAFVHIQQPQAVPALFALAMLIGFAYERTGSLSVPIAIHALFNLKTLVWDALQPFG